MIDFSLTDELQEFQDRTRAFIQDKIIPLENDPRQGPHGPSDELRLEVAALGRDAGLREEAGFLRLMDEVVV